jgi:hypothetical protein
MSQYTRSAAYDVVNYAWNSLVEAGVLDPSDYYVEEIGTTMIPITPVQEPPEFANILGDKPYIVYTYVLKPNFDDNIFLAEETLIFTIFCPDPGKIMAVMRVFSEAFRAKDEAAKRLQDSPDTSGKYYFNWTSIDGMEMSGESDSESGRVTGEVIVCYSFSENMNFDGTLVP